jgi:hypothetical protein
MAFIRLESGDFPGAAERAEEAASLYLEMGAAPKAARTLAIAAEAWEKDGQDERAREVRSRTRSLVSS